MNYPYNSVGQLLIYKNELEDRISTLSRGSGIIEGLLTSGVAYDQDLLFEEKRRIDRELRCISEIVEGVESRIEELEAENR